MLKLAEHSSSTFGGGGGRTKQNQTQTKSNIHTELDP